MPEPELAEVPFGQRKSVRGTLICPDGDLVVDTSVTDPGSAAARIAATLAAKDAGQLGYSLANG